MKKIKIATIMSFISMMLMTTSCQKDKHVTETPVDENRDIRVLKVEFNGSGLITGMGTIPVNRTIHYRYHENTLKQIDIETPSTGYQFNNPYINIEYKENTIIFQNNHRTSDKDWKNTIVSVNNQQQVHSLQVLTPLIFHIIHFEGIGDVEIKRWDNSLLKRVGNTGTTQSTYQPICTQVLSYNLYGLPEKTISEKDTNNWTYGAFSNTFEFDFIYSRAEKIPSKLKRLINEELLYLNRYGVANYDVGVLMRDELNDEPFLTLLKNGKGLVSTYGEGNWLVSFGLPQYHILEDKSTHIVSKRTTKHYKINDAGEREYIKTTVEDFPYVHDASAKTLEIAGLKIWYEFIE